MSGSSGSCWPLLAFLRGVVVVGLFCIVWRALICSPAGLIVLLSRYTYFIGRWVDCGHEWGGASVEHNAAHLVMCWPAHVLMHARATHLCMQRECLWRLWHKT
jgi:hypothetical protein